MPTTPYHAIQSGRLYEQIVDQIEQRILAGELRADDRLPAERDLALQFGVSRTAVREAVKTLRQKGLLEIQPGRGTFVTNRTARAARTSLGLMMKLGDTADSRNLTEVREILEPEIAALAATRATEDDLATMRQAIATMDAALHDVDTFIEADLNFHLALARATQNGLIPTLIDPIVALLREHRKRVFNTPGAPERGQQYHKRIFDSVRKRNASSAREAMRAHLQQVRQDSQTRPHAKPVKET